LVLAATAVEAQSKPPIFMGILSGHIGAVSQGDVRDWTLTSAASLAVIDDHGLGAEVDVGYSGGFDTEQFADSSITTLMLNFVAMYPHAALRPFLTAGGGVSWVRAETIPGGSSLRDTDLAWNLGGGVLYLLSDAIAVRGDVRYFRNFGQDSTIPLDGAFDFLRSSFGISLTWPIR
jgi:opacity protein-like surface antigen